MFNIRDDELSALIVGILLVFVIYLILKRPRKIDVSLSNWRQYFEELGMQPHEFFQRVEKSIMQLGITDIEFSRVTYSQGGIFSPDREYFRISRNEYVIDICASPFGKAFFVSYWKGQTKGGLLARIPIINRLLGKDRNYKTYYQLDTEMMFQEAVHACIMSVINEIAESKGIRGTAEFQRNTVNYLKAEPN